MPFVEFALLLLPVLLVVILFRAQRQRQRAFAAQQAALAVGQPIVTTAGLYATLVGLGDTVAVLEIAPGQTVRWDRRAIALDASVQAEMSTSEQEVSH